MNYKQNIRILTLQITIICILQNASAQQQIHYAGGYCLTTQNVSTTSIYHDNIISVLDILVNQSSRSKFFQTSSGNGSNLVNGLYVCRPDIDLDTCRFCVDAAVSTFNQYCYTEKETIIWYQECMLRYTNRTIFTRLQTEPWKWSYSTLNVSQPDIFPDLLNKTLLGIIKQASAPNNIDRFAFDSTTFTVFEGLYGMAWCTPDITPSRCNRCLTTALSRIPTCCSNGLAQRTTVLLPSCVLRYDTAPFIFASSPSRLAPSPSPS